MEALTPPELVLVEDVRRALAVALGPFADRSAEADFSGAERWASIAFRLVAALEESSNA